MYELALFVEVHGFQALEVVNYGLAKAILLMRISVLVAMGINLMKQQLSVSCFVLFRPCLKVIIPTRAGSVLQKKNVNLALSLI